MTPLSTKEYFPADVSHVSTQEVPSKNFPESHFVQVAAAPEHLKQLELHYVHVLDETNHLSSGQLR